MNCRDRWMPAPGALLLAAVITASGAAQTPTPQPFPQPGAPRPAAPPPAAPAPQPPAPAPAAPAQGALPAPVDPNAPTEAELGFPIYPAARYIASYDAGQGQRYHIFGAEAPYSDLVAYYRSVLRERGDEIFDQPPTHMFEVGRFRNDEMAFPPGVTVKDWTWGGSAGYPNPDPNGQPARFATIVMIVPPPPAPAAAR